MEPLAEAEKTSFNNVFCWGLAAEGQLGVGSTENSSIPLKVKYLTNIIDISAGGQFSAAVCQDGSLFMWGSNKKYQLSLENTEVNYVIPTKIKNISNIISVACGDWHTVIIDNKGIGYSVGYNKSGCLGVGDYENRSLFTPIPKEKTNYIKIAAGRNISLFLTDNNVIHSAGSGYMNGNRAENINLLTPIETLKTTRINEFSAGFSCCACVDDAGNVYSWGESEDYQLGHGNKVSTFIPKQIESLKNITQISCSRGDKHCHVGCVDSDGNAYSWGSGYKAKLGHGDTKDQTNPKLIEFFAKGNIKIKQFIAGGIHSACLSVYGELYTFGCGSDGRLGHPEKGTHKYLYKEKIPKSIEAFKEFRTQKAFSSYYHMISLS